MTDKPNLTRVWASAASNSSVIDPGDSKISNGWSAEIPTYEHFNYLQKWFTAGLAHANEQGIMKWDINTTYPIGGITKGSDGELYVAVIEHSGVNPVNEIDATTWQTFESKYVTQVPLSTNYFDSLDFPHVHENNNKIAILSSADSAGGTISITAGNKISINKVDTANLTGHPVIVTTPMFNKTQLNTSSQYYLRGKVDSDGTFVIYVQNGTDADGIPASNQGTINGSSGGGFDSTSVDILFAKIETNGANQQPTVTELVNKKRLCQTYIEEKLIVIKDNTWTNFHTYTYNWARKPVSVIPIIQGVNAYGTRQNGSDVLFGGGTHSTSTLVSVIAVKNTTTATRSRYEETVQYTFSDSETTNGRAIIALYVEA